MPAPKVFPTRLFFFGAADPGIDRRTLEGGSSLSGVIDVVATDGGGVITVEYGDPYLDEPEAANAWDACDTYSEGGAYPFIVPLTDAKHQGFGEITTPIGGFPWWEESDFADTEPHASLTADAALRATFISVDVSRLTGPVRAGIFLSIKHPSWSHRAYRIREVVSDNGAVAVLSIRPPLREAADEDTPVELYDPKCVMRVDGSMRAPRSLGYAASQGVRFIEDFSGAYS